MLQLSPKQLEEIVEDCFKFKKNKNKSEMTPYSLYYSYSYREGF